MYRILKVFGFFIFVMVKDKVKLICVVLVNFLVWYYVFLFNNCYLFLKLSFSKYYLVINFLEFSL